MEYRKSGNTIAVRIDYDEEVMEKLTELCKRKYSFCCSFWNRCYKISRTWTL